MVHVSLQRVASPRFFHPPLLICSAGTLRITALGDLLVLHFTGAACLLPAPSPLLFFAPSARQLAATDTACTSCIIRSRAHIGELQPCQLPGTVTTGETDAKVDKLPIGKDPPALCAMHRTVVHGRGAASAGCFESPGAEPPPSAPRQQPRAGAAAASCWKLQACPPPTAPSPDHCHKSGPAALLEAKRDSSSCLLGVLWACCGQGAVCLQALPRVFCSSSKILLAKGAGKL